MWTLAKDYSVFVAWMLLLDVSSSFLDPLMRATVVSTGEKNPSWVHHGIKIEFTSLNPPCKRMCPFRAAPFLKVLLQMWHSTHFASSKLKIERNQHKRIEEFLIIYVYVVRPRELLAARLESGSLSERGELLSTESMEKSLLCVASFFVTQAVSGRYFFQSS